MPGSTQERRALIDVRRIGHHDPFEMEVIVGVVGDQTRHQVTLSGALHQRLTGGKLSAERCVEAAFRFLLDREPKEAILGQFDLGTVATYLPEFEAELPRYF